MIDPCFQAIYAIIEQLTDIHLLSTIPVISDADMIPKIILQLLRKLRPTCGKLTCPNQMCLDLHSANIEFDLYQCQQQNNAFKLASQYQELTRVTLLCSQIWLAHPHDY